MPSAREVIPGWDHGGITGKPDGAYVVVVMIPDPISSTSYMRASLGCGESSSCVGGSQITRTLCVADGIMRHFCPLATGRGMIPPPGIMAGITPGPVR